MRATPLVLLTALAALALLAPLAGAQQEPQREPQRDYMVHMDLSTDPPRFIPDELTLLPGGTVQLMLFGKGGAHSITLDSAPTFEAAVAAGTTDGFYERTAQFQGPQAPGTYAFHDKNSGARGTLIVRSNVAAQPPLIGVRKNGYDLHFAPERLVVTPGVTVTFRTNGSFAHTLTSAGDAAWNDSTLQLAPGQSATFTAPTTPGEYPFYCRYHKEGGMIGVLVVEGAPAPAASTAASPLPPPPTSEAAKPTPALALPLLSLSVATALIIYSRTKR